jgi:hypothetical protein
MNATEREAAEGRIKEIWDRTKVLLSNDASASPRLREELQSLLAECLDLQVKLNPAGRRPAR